MAHGRAQYGTDLLSTSQDMLTALDRSAMALNMIAHTLENEFSERFGHTGVRGDTRGGAAPGRRSNSSWLSNQSSVCRTLQAMSHSTAASWALHMTCRVLQKASGN